jgi:hypothetical protein
MKHASAKALEQIESLLAQVRRFGLLTERKPGIFYRGSSAFLHFHEDPAGLFADIKLNSKRFERMPVSTPRQRSHFISVVGRHLAPRKHE